jgi:hypothetical protein
VQPLLQWKNNKYYTFRVCVCGLRYPACNAHGPYCRLWPVWLYSIIPHYLIKGTISEKKLLNMKGVFWFSLQLLSETFFILSRIERDIIKNVYLSSVKFPLFLSDINETWNIFPKTTQISKFIKIHPTGAELFHSDGQTDMKKLIVTFRNFSKAPKN